MPSTSDEPIPVSELQKQAKAEIKIDDSKNREGFRTDRDLLEGVQREIAKADVDGDGSIARWEADSLKYMAELQMKSALNDPSPYSIAEGLPMALEKSRAAAIVTAAFERKERK